MLILNNQLKYPKFNSNKDIMSLLVRFSHKIQNLPIPTTIIQALGVIALSHSYFPQPFLFEAEFLRLKFS